MTLSRGKLADIQYISNSTSSVYSNPSSTKTFVGGIILHNTNTTNETVRIFNVPDNAGNVGTATTAHRFVRITLIPDQTWQWRAVGDGLPLTDVNDSIQADSTNANVVTLQILGVKDI